ncbi:hypothetical protein MBLNU230_g8610t1 [Neophaeotheca triangularis]
MSPASTVAAIKTASSIEEQITKLRQLKNEIIGHEQRKEIVIQNGLVQPLIDIVASAANGKGRQDGGVSLTEPGAWSWSPEDEVRLQATLILGTIANSGPAFVAPLLAGGARKVLISGLSKKTQPRLVVSTLQALQNIFAALSDAEEMDAIDSSATAGFFEGSVVDTIHELLPEEPTRTEAKHMNLIAGIIRHAVKEESDRTLIAKSRILDRFAQYLADYAVSQGHVIRQSKHQSHTRTPPESIIPSILDATAVIIGNSQHRASRFVLAIARNKIFISANSSPSARLLPTPPTHAYKSVSFQSGPQSIPMHPSRFGMRSEDGPQDTFHGGCGGVANSLCAWLIHLARTFSGHARLAALSLLARVHAPSEDIVLTAQVNPEDVQKVRERSRKVSLYAVPMAVELMEEMTEGGKEDVGKTNAKRPSSNDPVERLNACLVLAQLVATSREMQTAAVEAGAIRHLCAVLKKSFDPITLTKPMWIPKPNGSASADTPETCRMGGHGIPNEIMQSMRARRGALAAIAAICATEDLHRKAIVENGAVPCIVDSLKLLPSNLEQKLRTTGRLAPRDGNTVDTIIAACSAARMMSRSVSLLRTSLIDAGIAKPLFSLINHPNDDVKIEATNVCCNLVLDFSPMREDIMAAGAVKILTEHARTGSAPLRLSSLWSLKHLVLSAPKEVKLSTLQELGPEWLIGVISGDRPSDASTHSGSGGVSLADLLNPSSMDVDNDTEPHTNAADAMDDEDGAVIYDGTNDTHYQSSSLRSTLKTHAFHFSLSRFSTAVKAMETHESRQPIRDASACQEQALDFIRNLVNGDSAPELTDHLLSTLGTDRVLTLLTNRLAPSQPPELTLSALHLVNHMAAASPRHRALLTDPANRSLLQNWLPLFGHPDRRIRVICVWAIINLTWVENESERAATRQRCQVLRDLGFVDAVGRLQQDGDLDVRERVRTVERQIMAL